MSMSSTRGKFKETEIGFIPEEWNVFSIEMVSAVIGGGTPSTSNTNNFNGPIPWITPRDLSSYLDRYISRGERNISEEGLNSSNAKLISANSVLLTTRAPVGYLAIASNELTTNQGFHSLIPNEKTDSLFLFYLLKNNVQTLIDNASGSTFRELNSKTLRSLKFAFPEIKEQKKITEILSSLDDKIELNRKINKNLEEIASAIFKKWFIDIGDGLPEGWMLAKLSDYLSIKTGKKDVNISTQEGQYPFFTCSKDRQHADCYSFDVSALLLAGNGDFNIKWYEGKFEAYQRTYVLIPHKKELLGFFYYLIKYFLNEITAGHRGSVIKFLTKGMVENFQIRIPDNQLLTEKAKIFNKINQTISFYKNETQHLVMVRNLLLPKIMCGKIRL